MKDILTQRHLVLSTIKTAIVDGGELSLDMFLRVSRRLPASLCSPQYQHLWAHEPTSGFICIRRRYKFSHVDTSADVSEAPVPVDAHANEKHPARCYSQLPLDSLMAGVFFGLSELKLIMSVCRRHSAQLARRSEEEDRADSKRKPKKNKSQTGAENEDVLIRDIIHHYSKTALAFFDKGEFVTAAGWMMLLQAFFSTNATHSNDGTSSPRNTDNTATEEKELNSSGDVLEHPPSFCMSQLASLTANTSGRLQSAVGSVETIITCTDLLIQSIYHVASSRKKETQEAILERMADVYHIYDAIGPFLMEVREIVLCLHRDVLSMHCSDAFLVMDTVMADMASLFHPMQALRPLLPKSEALKLSRTGGERSDLSGILQDMTRSLKALNAPLRRISAGLQLLGSSISGDTMLEILQMDADCRHRYKTPISMRALRAFATGAKDIPNPSWQPLDMAPKTFSELIGYCQARTIGMNFWYH